MDVTEEEKHHIKDVPEDAMNRETFEEIYRNVPQEQKNQLVQFRFSHFSKKVRSGGALWEYILCGDGERTLLLIPGSWHVADIWFLNIVEFEYGFKVISLTYPGMETMQQLVDGVQEVFESENIEKVDILGHSFGGMIAQCYVRKYPGRVANLILSNTDFPHSPEERKRKIRLSNLLPEPIFLKDLKKTYIKLIEPLKLEEREFWQAYFEELYSFRITKDDFMGLLKCAFDFHKNYSFTPVDLKDWAGNLLILESDNDQYFPASQREALRALYPEAQIHKFYDGGHTPSIARRDEFNSVVKTFLETHSV
jgi:pimeloyl-ACP methyl ester carboxylesterase